MRFKESEITRVKKMRNDSGSYTYQVSYTNKPDEYIDDSDLTKDETDAFETIIAKQQIDAFNKNQGN